MARPDDVEKLGPLLVAPPSYLELRTQLREALGFPDKRRALLIGIDGVDGSGKSALAAWLSWQLEMPAVHLDLYLVRDSDPVIWRTDDLARVLDARHELGRPIIIEGVFLLDGLNPLKRSLDFLVFVEKEGHQTPQVPGIEPYLARAQPKAKADFVLEWSSADHDRRLREAHLRRLRP